MPQNFPVTGQAKSGLQALIAMPLSRYSRLIGSLVSNSRSGMTAALPLLLALETAGCASVHLSGSHAKTTQGFGVLNVHVTPVNKLPQVITTQGFGLVASARSVTLGMVRESLVLFPDASQCHTLIIVQNREQFEALRATLTDEPGKLNHICLTTEEVLK